MKVDPAVPGDQIAEALAELGVAGGRLDDFEVGGGGLEVGVEEGGVVAVARRVEADADDSDVGGACGERTQVVVAWRHLREGEGKWVQPRGASGDVDRRGSL